jgi:hypothetical protein
MDPLTIIEKILRKDNQQTLLHYFETPNSNSPIREAIQFYKHSQNWSNNIFQSAGFTPAAFMVTKTFPEDIVGSGVLWLISITSLLPYLLI